MKPERVYLHWSESPLLPDTGRYYDFKAFEAAALAAALEHPPGGGYYKTKITVEFDDGRSQMDRLDLAGHDTHHYKHHVTRQIQYLQRQDKTTRERHAKYLAFLEAIEWPDEERLETLTMDDHEAISDLRQRGFAVIVWTPAELDEANPLEVEDHSIAFGHSLLADLAYREEA